MSAPTNGWIGVDLDGTLAEYDGWQGVNHIGPPVPAMLQRVRDWLQAGVQVRIFTARVYPLAPAACLPGARVSTSDPDPRVASAATAVEYIQAWLQQHVGCELPLTCVKDYGMLELWDDRAIQVVRNTGRRADGQP